MTFVRLLFVLVLVELVEVHCGHYWVKEVPESNTRLIVGLAVGFLIGCILSGVLVGGYIYKKRKDAKAAEVVSIRPDVVVQSKMGPAPGATPVGTLAGTSVVQPPAPPNATNGPTPSTANAPI